MVAASDLMSALRAPFPADAIKVKPQTVTNDKTKGLVTFYVDSRLVAARLDEAVGAENWTDAYKVIVPEPAVGIPVECSLTVNGVTKVDVGQVAPGENDDKMWKSAYSDAFKRAAVKFGVGAYLYDSPNVWAEVKVGGNGKVQGFSDAGKKQAFEAYRRWIGAGAPNSSGAAPAQQAQPETATVGPKATAAQQKKLDRLIANLTSVDGSQDWAGVVEKYAQREFRHGREQLGTVEIEQAIVTLTEYLDSVQVPA